MRDGHEPDPQEALIARGLLLNDWAQTLFLGANGAVLLAVLAYATLTEPKAFAWYALARVAFLVSGVLAAWALVACGRAWLRLRRFARAEPAAYRIGQERLAQLAATGRNHIWQSDAYGRDKRRS